MSATVLVERGSERLDVHDNQVKRICLKDVAKKLSLAQEDDSE